MTRPKGWIELTLDKADIKTQVNTKLIAGVTDLDGEVSVVNIGGMLEEIKETPEQIFQLMEEAEKGNER